MNITAYVGSMPVLGIGVVGQVLFHCPRCGSPYVAQFTALDQRSNEIQNFTCTAGDCRYVGSASKG